MQEEKFLKKVRSLIVYIKINIKKKSNKNIILFFFSFIVLEIININKNIKMTCIMYEK